jgi:hypothetical protein
VHLEHLVAHITGDPGLGLQLEKFVGLHRSDYRPVDDPSLNRTSPRNTVPSPIKLRIGGCFLKNAHMAGFLSEFHSLTGTYATVAVEYPDLHGFYHGPRRMVQVAFDTRVLAK